MREGASTEEAKGASSASDAREMSDDERLAAIELAMKGLSPFASQCWAAAAADDFRLAGDVTLEIAPNAQTARATVVHDTAADPVLLRCLQSVAEAFPWPADLYGAAVQVPFSFAAPRAQYVIDRAFIPGQTQAGVHVRVLVDERNTGNPNLSMIEVEVAAGADIPMSRVDKDEAWVILAGEVTLSAAEVGGKRQGATALAAGDAFLVASGAIRQVSVRTATTLLRVAIPGGAEGVARGGAVPGERLSKEAWPQRRLQSERIPRVFRGARAPWMHKGPRRSAILVDAAVDKAPLSVVFLELEAGAEVPTHRHAKETEVVYMRSGEATTTVDGVTLPVSATSVVQVPSGVEHAATAKTALTAVQVYSPGGPEQALKERR